MGRPKSYKAERINTAVRFPRPLHDELAKAAAERDLSINYLIMRACEEFLERLIPVDEWKLTRD